MRINWMLFCDQVEVNPVGEYNLLGVREELFCSSIPLEIPQLAVVLGARVLSPGTSYVWISWRLAKTNQVLFNSDPGAYPIAGAGSGGPFQAIVPIYFHNVTLPEYGLYTLDIMKDDQLVAARSCFLHPDQRGNNHALQ
jgi:hypothetical protein